MIDTPLIFNVQRRAPELISPAKTMPRELKPLSDIDDQGTLRFLTPMIHLYRGDPTRTNKNPASVIREALANLLVFYYPFAGRLREGPGRKLMVDCTGEGMLFIEAEADVTLKQFGDMLQPPFPCMEELLYNVPGSDNILDSPLMLIQVTRLLCGGFIFAIRFNHTMFDSVGYMQFLIALSEIARGASTPSVLPVWQRELLFARDPPCVTCTHHEYDKPTYTKLDTINPLDYTAHRSFFFGPTEVTALRRFVPIHLQGCSTFDLITACLWRCRAIALQPDPEEDMYVICVVSALRKFKPPLPVGYYGNTLAFPGATSTARDLCNKPLGYALEIVMKTKSIVNEEYMRSIADLMVIKGRPLINVGSFMVSDVTQVGLHKVDFGWGNAVYAGPAKGGVISGIPGFTSYIPTINHIGESGVVVPICLPSAVMARFVNELNNMLMENTQVIKNHKLVTLPKL